jgi:two-component system alkaline phosphatase synthesis response regulator PhoP
MLVKVIVIGEDKEIKGIVSKLSQSGFNSSLISQDRASALLANTESIRQDKITPDFISSKSPDIFLVDIGFEKMLQLPEKLKKGYDVPILAIVSKEMIQSLNITKIDDFILKPLNFQEVILRIKQILWRMKNISDKGIIKCNDLIIDLTKYEVLLKGKPIFLTFKEFEVLKVLIMNKGRVLTREGLLNEIWGYDYFGTDRTVDVCIRRLRAKIEDRNHSFIETVRNVGYKFKG